MVDRADSDNKGIDSGSRNKVMVEKKQKTMANAISSGGSLTEWLQRTWHM